MSRQAELIRLSVVAGILRTPDGRVLITERVDDGPFHGLWEFPGGKIGAGETPEAALRRELAEEIGIEAVTCESFMQLEHTYPDRHVDIEFFLVTEWRNTPSGLEGQALQWVAAGQLDADTLLPADLPVVEALNAG